MHKRLAALFASLMIGSLVTLIGCDMGRSQKAGIDQTRAQVQRMAAELDQQTTATGTYVRVDGTEDSDAWATPLSVAYARGGLAETVTVRSAGPDRQFHTDDDIVASGATVNLAGVGEGIQQNVEETSAKVAKGAVRGVVQGVGEAVKERLARRPATAGSS